MSDASEHQLHDPVQFGPYFVTCLLGAGAAARVYRGFPISESADNLLAIKALHPSGQGKMARTRLEREAQIGAALRGHEHLLLPLRREQIGGQDVLVMPYLDGWTLREVIDACHEHGVWFNPMAIIDLMKQVALGLQAAHNLKIEGQEQNLVHRDLKPDNIMVGRDGRVKILDFGIAVFRDRVGEATQAGITVGTPSYLSPEQARGKALDHRSDLFAFGTILYELVSGERAFTLLSDEQVAHLESPKERRAEKFRGLMRAIATADPHGRDRVRTEALNEEMPSVADIVRSCWERNPDDRMGSALQAFLRLGMIEKSQEDEGWNLAQWLEHHEDLLPEAVEDGDFDPSGPPPEVLPNDHKTSVFVKALRPDETGELDAGAIQLLPPAEEEPSLDVDPDFEGVRFGRYELLCLLGSGSQAKVYLARTRGGNIVVLKVLHPDLTDEPDARRLIENEAKLGAILRGKPHNNVVGVFPLERIGGHLCLPMPYVPGWTLDLLLYRPIRGESGGYVLTPRWGDRKIPLSVISDIGMQICEGLAHVHGLDLGGEPVNVIHRDLKLSNIMVTPDGQVKILDFGIAKMSESLRSGPKTVAGTALGSPTYMSPEQATGGKLTSASDLFTVGSILYELAMGEPAFPQADLREVLLAIAGIEAGTTADRLAGVAPELAGVVRDCHARDLQERYARAGEIRKDLEPVFRLHGGEAKNLAAMLRSVSALMPKPPPYGYWGKDGPPKEVRDGDTDTSIFRALTPPPIEERFPEDREPDPSVIVEILDDGSDPDDVVTEVMASAGGGKRVMVQPLLRGTRPFPVPIEEGHDEDDESRISLPVGIALLGAFLLVLGLLILLLSPSSPRAPEVVEKVTASTPRVISTPTLEPTPESTPEATPEPAPESTPEPPREPSGMTPSPRVAVVPTPEPTSEATPEPTPVLEEGSLTFMVNPPARVYVGGSLIGETRTGSPLHHKLAPGQYTVTLECLACPEPRAHEMEVVVAPGKRVTRVYNFP